jgi:alpha-glucoside transport system permease protein
MNPALQGLVTIIIGVGGCVGYFFFSNIILDKFVFPATGIHAGRNINRANQVRPWLFLAPAIIALGVYLAYPVFATLWLSFKDKDGNVFVGIANYQAMFAEQKFWESMRNNIAWLIVVPALATAFGLLAAQLTDRIWWGNLAKSMIFMPMAISFVGASVIWKLVYDTRDVDQTQIGLLNAVWLKADGGIGSILLLKVVPSCLLLAGVGLLLYIVWNEVQRFSEKRGKLNKIFRGAGIVIALWLASIAGTWVFSLVGAVLPYGQPQYWLQVPFWNNFFLMAVLIWLQTGFAMVILSAALRGVPEETVEAAIIDGANPFQTFFKIKVPQIMPTIVVVWTTITITVLKVFDIVRAMTGGQQETQVMANYMYDKLFVANELGVGSASAMIILLLVMPILIWNVHTARKEMR